MLPIRNGELWRCDALLLGKVELSLSPDGQVTGAVAEVNCRYVEQTSGAVSVEFKNRRTVSKEQLLKTHPAANEVLDSFASLLLSNP